jgi:hypothetical protein
LGEKYIAALDRLAASPNGKIILMPADLLEALRGLIGSPRRGS